MTLFKDKYKIDSKRLKNWDYSSEGMYFVTLVTKNRKSIFGLIEEDKMILNENGQIIEMELLKSIKIRKNWFFHNWIVMPNHIHVLIEIMEPRLEGLQIASMQNVDIQNTRTHIVEAHSSASPSSISTKIGSNIAETHCCAPLRGNWDGIENGHKNQLDTEIVEAHSNASPSSISTKIGSNIAETHCCAPLRDNWDGIDNEKMNRKYENENQNSLTTTLSRKPNSISSFVALFKSVKTKQINGIESIWQTNYHDHIVRNYKSFEIIYNYIKTNPRLWEMDSMKL
ncbi:hypothetical protein CLU81_5238 [Flavobacterium sp. 9]|uniref:transposase n=1 Tax=Flavobacterium sp. 9 TaxID=2035198 RepID=UPI000C186E43|nr:transposase [Flavobacterium sp. 9]PIF34579.1 hypothetical protein CLU81_5238 [Flavobacterium sp. 9]